MKIIKKYFFILILLALSSCDTRLAKIFPERPSRKFQSSLADASPDFRKGWKDGCEVGMSGGSNTFYKMFYRNNAIDGYKMAESSDYKDAWGSAFWYCYRYDYIKHKGSVWSSTFGGYR